MENSATLKRSHTESNTQSGANENRTQEERGKRRKQRIGTIVTGEELDLFYANFSSTETQTSNLKRRQSGMDLSSALQG